jgi:o-succinylbenzoate synthase
MKIEAVELRHLKVPLISPFETSAWREEEKNCILVEMRSKPHTGFGECAVSSGPWYGSETIVSAWQVMEDYLIPAIIGKEFSSPVELLDRFSSVRGNNMAKASLEMAFCDLAARNDRLSLSKYLGGTKTRIESGVSVGIQKTAKLLVDTVSDYLDKGYRRIKVKIKPGKDVEQVSALRERFPDIMLMADANGAYDRTDFQTLVGLDQYGLLMLEQPFAWDDLVDHANLQRALRTPICLDESVSGINDLKTALALQSCRILNIKPARIGGLNVSKAMHDICRSHSMPVWCGGLLETGVGRAHNVALASLPGFVLPNDISATNRYFAEDIVRPEFKLNPDGTITVPSGKGLGVEIQQDIVEKYTLRKKLSTA